MKKWGKKTGKNQELWLIKNLLNSIKKQGGKPIIWYFVCCWGEKPPKPSLGKREGKLDADWLRVGARLSESKV